MNIKFKRNNIKLAIAAGIALSTVTLSMPAYAEAKLSKSKDMLVEAVVGDTCKITTQNLDFGEYDPVVLHVTEPLKETGGVLLTCTKGSTNTITMSAGKHRGGALGAGGSASRQMVAGNDAANFLGYEFYTNIGLTTVFDATTGSPYTGIGTEQEVDIFAQVFPGQTGVIRDDYSDTIEVTITY